MNQALDNLIGAGITIGILAWFVIIIYLKATKKTFNELMKEVMDLFKQDKIKQ